MEFNFDVGGTYIPKWRDNDKLQEANQIVMEWEYPSCLERSKIQYFTPMKVSAKGEEDSIGYKIDKDKAVSICIKKVKNLKVNGKLIETGEQLVEEKGLYSLVDELATFLIPKLREINEKN